MTAVNGISVDSAAQLRNIVGLAGVGDSVTLDLMRKVRGKRVTVRIAPRPDNTIRHY